MTPSQSEQGSGERSKAHKDAAQGGGGTHDREQQRPKEKQGQYQHSQLLYTSRGTTMLLDASEWDRLSRNAVYFDSAGRTPTPLSTLRVGEAALLRKAATPWSIGDAVQMRNDVRERYAALLGAGVCAQDIAVVPSCSYAMSLAANMLSHKLVASRCAVLVLEGQNHSNVMAWQVLCRRRGGDLAIVARPADGDWARAVLSRLNANDVAVCALPPCHWCDGAIIDLVAVSEACKSLDVSLVIDATQFVGAGGVLHAKALGAAVVASSIHKWLLGPYGAALLYVDAALYETATPLEHHDRNREGADLVECLPMGDAGYPEGFMPGAQRLDSGGRPSYIVMPMLRNSLDLILDLGVQRIADTLREITSKIRERAAALGFKVPNAHVPHIIGLRCAAWMPSAEEIVRRLAQLPRPVIVAERFGAIRISPYLHNTDADLDCLLEALENALGGSDEQGHSDGGRNDAIGSSDDA